MQALAEPAIEFMGVTDKKRKKHVKSNLEPHQKHSLVKTGFK
ncbi:hypothetical protein CIT292_07629 [Citrobacter youngae ATCC 29220]|uniref:Uncharacterized protein n=1 Tax=Citrobacter youngae ATCC 29220 TaxID=500640 RepID=D4BAY3_9ENTR|nr:hypothetical protein CIT292_07629 [Citrobacter youngae ATCC 29220]